MSHKTSQSKCTVPECIRLIQWPKEKVWTVRMSALLLNYEASWTWSVSTDFLDTGVAACVTVVVEIFFHNVCWMRKCEMHRDFNETVASKPPVICLQVIHLFPAADRRNICVDSFTKSVTKQAIKLEELVKTPLCPWCLGHDTGLFIHPIIHLWLSADLWERRWTLLMVVVANGSVWFVGVGGGGGGEGGLGLKV